MASLLSVVSAQRRRAAFRGQVADFFLVLDVVYSEIWY